MYKVSFHNEKERVEYSSTHRTLDKAHGYIKSMLSDVGKMGWKERDYYVKIRDLSLQKDYCIETKDIL